jgi:hypothetical protein
VTSCQTTTLPPLALLAIAGARMTPWARVSTLNSGPNLAPGVSEARTVPPKTTAKAARKPAYLYPRMLVFSLIPPNFKAPRVP